MNKNVRILAIGILISMIFVAVGCIWLSFSAETLDEIAEMFGASESPLWTPPFPDYELPGFEGNVAMNIVIGIVFTLMTLAVAFAVGKALKRRV